jgi:hypothetical protein
MQTLSTVGTTQITPTRVKLYRFTPEQMQAAKSDANYEAIVKSTNAAAWTERQTKEGNVVFMTMPVITALLSGQPLPEPSEAGAMKAGEQATKEAAKSPIGAVVAGDPRGTYGALMAGLGGPLGVAAIAAVAVGGVYYVSTRKKKAPRRRY